MDKILARCSRPGYMPDSEPRANMREVAHCPNGGSRPVGRVVAREDSRPAIFLPQRVVLCKYKKGAGEETLAR